MDKDRIEGSANQAKGSIKEGFGKLTGDKKLEAEGTADKAAGKCRTPSAAPKTPCATHPSAVDAPIYTDDGKRRGHCRGAFSLADRRWLRP